LKSKRITYGVFIAALVILTSSFTSSDSAYLNVKVTNIASKKGRIEIGLYNNSKKFPKVGKTFKMVRIKPDGSTLIHKFTNLPAGKYALCIYHDKNNDKKCNKNIIGIPTESYAFSNNFRPRFSAPKFSDCSFSLKKARMVTIRMVN
jgi:uncharacterized protein (DUF2141 family)